MTTTVINNVPRDLLERAWRALANSATGREIGAYLDADPCAPECAETCARASMCTACSDDLSAPSPAGVDGLNTDRNAAFKACPESGCDWGSFYLGWKARGEVEQAIIDGLRGEVASQEETANQWRELALQFDRHRMTAMAHIRAAASGDKSAIEALGVFAALPPIPGHEITAAHERQAQRIGELEGLLREVHDTYRAAIHWEDLRGTMKRIDAALSAGKEGE